MDLTKIQTAFESIPVALKGVIMAVAVVALIVAGVMMMAGRNGREAGKQQLLWVIIGIAVVASAFTIVTWVFSIFPSA